MTRFPGRDRFLSSEYLLKHEQKTANKFSCTCSFFYNQRPINLNKCEKLVNIDWDLGGTLFSEVTAWIVGWVGWFTLRFIIPKLGFLELGIVIPLFSTLMAPSMG